MLIVNSLSKSFGEHIVLDNVSFSLKSGEVVGLVGKNGSGKTTLFEIITGKITPDRGKVETEKETIGYLPQHFNFSNETIEEFLSVPIEESHKINTALKQVGLNGIDLKQRAVNLSGGQKTKLYLARILLNNPIPTTLLLDEPTNNLDFKGLNWLENLLQKFEGSVLVTSHDRAFLDNVTDRTLELSDSKIKSYGGNYSFYREQKLEQEKAELERYQRNTEEIKRLERQIREKKEHALRVHRKDKPARDNDKFAAGFFAQKSSVIARQAKGMESRLSQMESLEKLESYKPYRSNFTGNVHSNKTVIEVDNISKSFNTVSVLKNVTFSVSGNTHVWLAGENGSGKSTLLKIIAGQLKPNLGEVRLGVEIKAGYFSQEISQMNETKSGLEELMSTGATETDSYKYAARLHLKGNDLKKKLSELSRGQRAKIEFTKLLLSNNQLLILDEPTNHLEVNTREEIEEALKRYEGAILVASHDRYFLEELGIDQRFELQNGILISA